MGDFIRSLLRNTSSQHRPWQLSAAMALGVLCGLLPKFSLMFCLVGGVCCAAPIHLPVAALACLVSSIAATAMAATAGRLGLWSLTHPELMEMWLTRNSQPWVPWLGLNNSVVHGSLLIGLALLVPVYGLSKPIANHLAPPRQFDAAPADADFKHELRPIVARADFNEKTTLPIKAIVRRSELYSIAIDPAATWPDADEKLDDDEQKCQELENLLANCNTAEANELSADEVVQRAAHIVQVVDDLLTSCQLEATAPAKPRRHDEPPVRPVPQLHVNQLANTKPATHRAAGEAHQAESLRYLLHHLKAFKDKVETDAAQ